MMNRRNFFDLLVTSSIYFFGLALGMSKDRGKVKRLRFAEPDVEEREQLLLAIKTHPIEFLLKVFDV